MAKQGTNNPIESQTWWWAICQVIWRLGIIFLSYFMLSSCVLTPSVR